MCTSAPSATVRGRVPREEEASVYRCTISNSPGMSGQARKEEAREEKVNVYSCTIISSHGTSGHAREEKHTVMCIQCIWIVHFTFD